MLLNAVFQGFVLTGLKVNHLPGIVLLFLKWEAGFGATEIVTLR